MSGSQQLLRSHRERLLSWVCEHPAPLLRWLCEAEVLSWARYLSLLETSSSNAVVQALEEVSASEESSRRFLEVLEQVQDYYGHDLQLWVKKNCTRETRETRERPQEKKTKSYFANVLKGKSLTLPKGDKGENELKTKKMKSGNIRLAISAHKTTVLKRTEQLKSYSEGDATSANSASHIEIRYTDLFVTEDDDLADHNSRHEYFDLASRRARIYVHQACQRVQPCDLLSPTAASSRAPKRVKVKGIAGIGKSVAVQRLLYEWAIGKNMSKFDFVFDLRFRELNLVEKPMSLLELLGDRFCYLKDVLHDLFKSPEDLLFILDGLDEFKFPLKWNDPVKDIGIESKVPVSDLMVALIEGFLLPKCSVIVTTRPSTEAPKKFFQRCCIVLGFEEKQVKEYASKFYKNVEVADKVYDYILSNDNLFVLSFIPLYCYIICMAMDEFFSSENRDPNASGARLLELNPPKTVSEVYFYYLFTAVKHHALKGTTDRNTTRAQVLSLAKVHLTNLGKLAYENLLQKTIMFNKDDLEKYAVSAEDIRSTFLCHILQLLNEESVDMYSFFHLTVQEHLAALYCAANLSTADHVLKALDMWCFGERSSNSPQVCNTDIHTDKLESLQMFTRFFMGTLRARLEGHLEGLVTHPMEEARTIPAKLGEWFQDQFKNRKLKNLEVLNLLHCLMEFHMEETTKAAAPEIKRLNLYKMKLSVVDCAAMRYVLQFSPHKLQELNLGYSNIGNKGLSRLEPILHRCESLYLRYNCLDRPAPLLCSILKSHPCHVKKLFMCGNNLGPEGVLDLCQALEHNNTLEELYLDITGITPRGTENMVTCLGRNSCLKTLTIVGNDIGDEGRRRLRRLRRCRPELRVIASFVDDVGLLQAYLDWVEEIQADKDQMESVKNADALLSVLHGLQETGDGTGTKTETEISQKAKLLQLKITQLLDSGTT
ncbi:unnamed protein product [Knipowitschia caucasica]